MDFVLDCSIAISWCFEDEANQEMDRILDLVKNNGAWVPNLWHLEILNVLIQASKRGRIPPASIVPRIHLLSKLPIKTDSETFIRAFTDTMYLAQTTQLTSYDTAYLELARRKGVSLATKDRAMVKAAKMLDIPILI